MCLIRYSSDSAFSCGSVVSLPVCISVLRITLWLRCLLFITITVTCQKWYRTGFQRTPLLHLFIWKYFHQKVQVIFDWMLFRWKVIAWKSQCLPALDRKICQALQRCHGGACLARYSASMPAHSAYWRGKLHLSGRRLVNSYLPWTGWDLFFFFIRRNDFQ